MNFVFYIVFNWFFYYLVEIKGFSAMHAGLVTSAQWIAGANAMGFVNALLLPFFAMTFGWDFAISSGAIFALIGAALMLLVRADQPLSEGG